MGYSQENSVNGGLQSGRVKRLRNFHRDREIVGLWLDGAAHPGRDCRDCGRYRSIAGVADSEENSCSRADVELAAKHGWAIRTEPEV